MSKSARFAGLLFALLGLVPCGCSAPEQNSDAANLGDMGPPADAQVRVAHLVAGAPPFDVCVKSSSDSEFRGPLIRQNTMRTIGVSYPKASLYMALPPATYTMRAVPGSATTCAISLASLPDVEVAPLLPGRHYTLTAMGYFLSLRTLKFAAVEDDVTRQAGMARLHFLHAAALQGGLELGTGATSNYVRLLSASNYGDVGTSDAGQAYVSIPAQDPTSFSLRDSGGGSDLLSMNATINAEAAYTIAAIGAAGTAMPLKLFLCNDTTDPSMGLSICQESPGL